MPGKYSADTTMDTLCSPRSLFSLYINLQHLRLEVSTLPSVSKSWIHDQIHRLKKNCSFYHIKNHSQMPFIPTFNPQEKNTARFPLPKRSIFPLFLYFVSSAVIIFLLYLSTVSKLLFLSMVLSLSFLPVCDCSFSLLCHQ